MLDPTKGTALLSATNCIASVVKPSTRTTKSNKYAIEIMLTKQKTPLLYKIAAEKQYLARKNLQKKPLAGIINTY